MAIDPKKMEAWLADGKGKKDGGGGNPQDSSGKKKGPPPKSSGGDHDDEEHGDDEEETESDDEKEAEGDLEDQFPTLFQSLEDYGDMVEEAGDSFEQSDLDEDELDGDTMQLMKDAIPELPKPVVKALKKEGSKLDRGKANEIADALATGEHIQDADHFAGFLFHLAQAV